MADVLDSVAYGDSSVDDVSDVLAAVSWDYLIRLFSENESIDYAGLLADLHRAAGTDISELDLQGDSPSMDSSSTTSNRLFELFPAAMVDIELLQGDRAIFDAAVAGRVSDIGSTGVPETTRSCRSISRD